MKRIALAFLVLLITTPAWSQTNYFPYNAGQVLEVTGTGTNANDTPVPATAVTGFRWVAVQLKGTWTGTVVFEQSNDNSTWVSTALISVGATSVLPVTSVTANDVLQGPVSGHYFRVRFSVASSGTVTAVADFSPALGGWQAKVAPGACATCVTSAAPLTNQAPVIGQGGQAVATVAAMTNGQVLIGSTGAQPVPAAITGTANQIGVTNGAGSITLSIPSSPIFPGTATASRYKNNGTALAAGDFVASAGWGSTASFSAVSGTDQRWQVTITSTGTGQAANPTITLTYHDGTWTTAPITQLFRNGGTGAGVTGFTVSNNATTATITATGTPVLNETYILTGAN